MPNGDNMENKSFHGWLVGAFTSFIAVAWAVFTYVIPDPSVLGFDAINWKNILIILLVVICVGWIFIYVFALKLPVILRHSSIVFVYLLTAVSFFWIGTKYEDPLFGASEKEAVYVYNDSATILGKRIETIDNISIQLVECQKAIGKIICKLDFVNNSIDRDISFRSETRAFDDSSNEIDLESVVIGSSNISTWDGFSLPKGIKTSVIIAFKLVNNSSSKLTSLRLRFSGMNGIREGVKFDDVPIKQ
jgi:hypothetical protein